MSRIRLGLVLLGLLALVACSGSGNQMMPTSTPTATPTAQSGTVNLTISDASAQDWSVIGVKVLSVALVPQNGGAPVTVYTAPTPAPHLNLVQLDQLGEILASVQVPVGTYTRAILTIGGNPGDVLLTAATDPTPGFAGTPGATIPSSQIVIQGASGTAPNLTVPVSVTLQSPLVVSANQTVGLNLEADLSHPAFIVEHVPPSGATYWAVNFGSTFRHQPIEVEKLVLRHIYGTVTAIAADNTAITVKKVHPDLTSPGASIGSSQSLQILADAVNGTLFFDIDAKTRKTITNFSSSSVGTLTGKYVRVVARYEPNGNLVAARIWASTSFQKVWLSPEGHVLHVNAATNVITVENEDGQGIPITVNANTDFFFRIPFKAINDATPIATGTGFLAAGNLVRGFKVHVNVVDPLASPLVADDVDIEDASFEGVISAPNNTGFVLTRKFNNAADNYTVTLPYLNNATKNGKDANGNQILGFKWWYFSFPTLLHYGANAIPDFISATNGSVTFGGSVSPISVWGNTVVTWGDPANPNGWSAQSVTLAPSPMARGTVATAWTPTAGGGLFGMSVPGGANVVTVSLSSVAGSATLVYQVDRTNNVVTVSQQDITTTAGMNNVAGYLQQIGTPVGVFGVPQANGTIKAYVLMYYTGTRPK